LNRHGPLFAHHNSCRPIGPAKGGFYGQALSQVQIANLHTALPKCFSEATPFFLFPLLIAGSAGHYTQIFGQIFPLLPLKAILFISTQGQKNTK
jgi:hypothetical protein